MTDSSTNGAGSIYLAREAILCGLSPDQAAAYQRFADWFDAVGVTDGALKVGDIAPDFLLADAAGRLVASRDLRRTGPVVVTFIRGDWCAFCAAELRALHAALPTVRGLGANLVVITPDVGSYARDAIAREGLNGLEILADMDHGVSLAFGIVFVVPEELRTLLAGESIDLPTRHGGPGWMLPVPATYVIDTDGLICHAFVEPDYSRRQDPKVFLKMLRELAG